MTNPDYIVLLLVQFAVGMIANLNTGSDSPDSSIESFFMVVNMKIVGRHFFSVFKNSVKIFKTKRTFVYGQR
jgi:hypothetical protein